MHLASIHLCAFVLHLCSYRVAEVEWVQDIKPPEGSVDREDVSLLFSLAIDGIKQLLRNLLK